MTTGNKVGRGGESTPTHGVGAAVITKSDTNELPKYSRWIFCGGAGNLRVKTLLDEDVLFTGVIAGQIIPIAAKQVFSTNTTTTNMAAIY